MLLDGRSLAGFIKERQAAQMRRLRAKKVFPKLAIVQIGSNPVSEVYIRMKQKYGSDINSAVAVNRIESSKIKNAIAYLNDDNLVHGIIVQLPLPRGFDNAEILNAIAPNKDVDGLGNQAEHQPATPTAILWLLTGYNIDLKNKQIAVVGQGQLVGRPLLKLLQASGYSPIVFDENSKNLEKELPKCDVIITATGQPGLIKPEMIKIGATVIDAGTSDEGGKNVGDVDKQVYERKDIKISPVPGGVGPLTVCALFENLIQAAQ